MQILVFNERFIETANHLCVRTGIELCKGEWKPQPHKGYIIFAAEDVIGILSQAQEKLNLTYVVMNNIEPDNAPPEYLEFVRKNKLICQNISFVNKYQKLGIDAEYGINEYFVNEPKPSRRINFLLWVEAELILPPTKKALYLRRYTVLTPDELTNKMTSCLTYVSTRKNDWDFIHKAISCGMNILSCREDADMEKIYEPFVTFKDEIDLSEKYNYPSYDNKLFLKTVSTFSLNKMIPIIKDVYIQTESEKKERHVTISTGEDEQGSYAEITPTQKEEDTSGSYV